MCAEAEEREASGGSARMNVCVSDEHTDTISACAHVERTRAHASTRVFAGDELRASLRLYAVTDDACLGGRPLEDAVAAALRGGAGFVQLRVKGASTSELVWRAQPIQELCAAAHAPFVINDDVEAAVRANADGVHVGQSDLACTKARAMLGADKIVGVSVQTVEQALRAQEEGATYLGVGALFGTPTKPDAIDVSFEELVRICAAVSIPVVGIGGMNASTVSRLAGTGVVGAAVVSALFAAPDVQAAATELRCLLDKALD